jgi:hypothetical protein
MKKLLYWTLAIGAVSIVGCSSDTSRAATSDADKLKAVGSDPVAKAREQNSINSGNIERRVRETGLLPNGQPIPRIAPPSTQGRG